MGMVGAMQQSGDASQFHFTPEHYLELMHAEVPRYDELQDETSRATQGRHVRTILELGVGTGETSRRVLARHPGAKLTGIDASAEMLAEASLPGADLRVGRLEDALPDGPFDLVVSCLAIYHLDGTASATFFTESPRRSLTAARFVLGDVVVPERPEDAVIEIDGVYDVPSSVAEQLAWLDEAGFDAEATWVRGDLAVFVATPGPEGGSDPACPAETRTSPARAVAEPNLLRRSSDAPGRRQTTRRGPRGNWFPREGAMRRGAHGGNGFP